MKIASKTVNIGVAKDKTGAISYPIYQTATFAHPSFGNSTGYDYSRSSNPTRQLLEDAVAELEGGCRGFAYSSGLAAISSVLALFKPGDHLLVTEDLYGGTFRLLDKVFAPYGLEASYVDTSNLTKIAEQITPTTKAIFLETPTNPLLKIADIEGIAKLCRDHKLLLIVDNTFLTPYFQRPLDLGADIVIHSASKYLSGHNDVVAGLVIAKTEELAEQIYFLQNAIGAVLGPQDSWLVVRGMKTLAIRLERQESNALKIAQWLEKHESVTKVYYPGLKNHEGYELQQKQADGFGAMVSFETKNSALAQSILNNVQLIAFAESLGGVESLITYPAVQTHADMCAQALKELGINDRLLRFSVGIEDVDDLIADLKQAFELGGA